MHTIEKLKRYRAHLEAHKAYMATKVYDPLSNHASEKSPLHFAMSTSTELTMAQMIREEILGKINRY